MLTAALLLCSMVIPAAASDPYQGYSYSTTDEGTHDVAAPQAYLPEKVYNSKDLGAPLTAPEDLLFDSNGNLCRFEMPNNLLDISFSEISASAPLTTTVKFITTSCDTAVTATTTTTSAITTVVE